MKIDRALLDDLTRRAKESPRLRMNLDEMLVAIGEPVKRWRKK